MSNYDGIEHTWTNEEKNHRRLWREADDNVEILWCLEHKKYELIVGADVYHLPIELEIVEKKKFKVIRRKKK